MKKKKDNQKNLNKFEKLINKIGNKKLTQFQKYGLPFIIGLSLGLIYTIILNYLKWK